MHIVSTVLYILKAMSKYELQLRTSVRYYVTGFKITRLPHTQQEGILFTITR